MYIGHLSHKALSFTHAESSVPFPPSSQENEVYTWEWDTLFDAVLDISTQLEQPSYVGAVVLQLGKKHSVKKAEVLINRKTVGVYHAGTEKSVGGEIAIPVGAAADRITVRLYANMEAITLESLQILGAHEDGNPLVWPQPKSLSVCTDRAPIGSIEAQSSDPDEQYAATFLRERLAERYGISEAEEGMRILLVKDTSSAYDKERYTLHTEKNTVTVTAASRLALLYAVDTLMQTASKEGIAPIEVDDKPSKEFRGLHIGLPSRENFDFVKRLLRYVVVPLRFNLLIVQFTAGMRFDKHPELNEAWLRADKNFKEGIQPRMPHSGMIANGQVLEKHEVTDLLDSARELGLEIVPEIQSLGHVQYITYAHPELAERIETPDGDVDSRADDVKPVGFYPHCYCPSLQASYDLMYDVIDEIVEVVNPTRYVHMGHDEIYHIGRCHRCQMLNPSDLYVKHVTAMYDHLKKKGLKMMIWSDMIHTDPNRKYYVPDARERLPRDILMLDFVWYFRPEADIEEELLPFGYQLAVGNLYSSHFTRYRSRISKEGMIGGQISLWLPTAEKESGQKGKWWDMTYLSQMLWNPETYEEHNRMTYSHVIGKHLQPRMRDELRGTQAPNGYASVALPAPDQSNSPFQKLSALCPEAIRLEKGRVNVNAAFDRLVFEHATAWNLPIDAWEEPQQIGAYVISYEDGTEERADVMYAKNIMCYTHRYGFPMPYKYYRHTGYVGTWFADPVYQGHAEDGTPLSVTGYVWENPHPDKKIASIAYCPAENDYSGLILAGIKGQIKQ